MRRRLFSLAVVLAGIAVVLAGCGSGEDADPYAGQAKPPTTVNTIHKDKNPDQ